MIKGRERNRDLALGRNLLLGRSISASHISLVSKPPTVAAAIAQTVAVDA
jgi:hypothetical protein